MDNVYYDWNKTFTYNAEINVIVSMRGLGKTYGIRKQVVRDFLKDGSRFMEIVRYKELLKGESAVQYGYFDKLVLNKEFPDYQFKVTGTNAYIAKIPQGKEKPKWELIGYFVALSGMQQSKQRTFVNVRRVIFDEFIIDKRTGHRYLQGEFDLFVNLIDSVAREEVTQEGEAMGTKIRCYLLGNACDLTNPYFIRWGINKQPKDGYSWHNNKLVLLHYVKDKVYQHGKRKTLVGRLIAGTSEEDVIIDNVFVTGDEYNIGKKTSNSKFELGIVYRKQKFGLWIDVRSGYIYVNGTIPKESGKPIFALTKEDNTANYIQLRKGEKMLKQIMDYYYADIMKFSTVGIRDTFLETMELFGIR